MSSKSNTAPEAAVLIKYIYQDTIGDGSTETVTLTLIDEFVDHDGVVQQTWLHQGSRSGQYCIHQDEAARIINNLQLA